MRVFVIAVSLLSFAEAGISSLGSTCQQDIECSDDGWYVCQDNICDHKRIFPLKPLEFWGLIAVAAVLFYSSLGGVSGAGLVMPMTMGFMRFDAKNAIAFSNASTFVGSVFRFFVFSGQPHPLKNGKGLLVDQNLAVLAFPLIIMGVSVGVLLNIIVPNVFLLAFFVVICLYMSIGIYKKASKQYNDETEAAEQIEMVERRQLMEVPERSGLTNKITPEIIENKNSRLQEIIEAESTNFQWRKLGLNGSLVIILVLISFMRGGDKSTDSILGLEKCDAMDWGLFGILQAICVVYFYAGYRVVAAEIEEKEQCGYNFVPGDLKMTAGNFGIIAGLAFFGSMFAAMSGIGPGLVFSGGLVMLGIEPRVGSATGMYLTTLMTLSSTIQLLALRKIKLDYLVYVLVMTVIGCMPGMFFQTHLAKVTGRNSTNVYILSSCLVIAGISILVVYLPMMVQQIKDGGSLIEVGQYC